MSIPNHVLQATKERFAEREKARKENTRKIKAGNLKSANNAERFELRKERLERAGVRFDGGLAVAMDKASVVMETATPLLDLALERVIGRSDFVGVAYLELGVKVAATVGRIHIGTRNGGTNGFGTGFLVSPRLLLTNNHVLSNAAQADVSNVEFNYQQGIDGNFITPVTFELDPDTFFTTDEHLDYTLVAVKERALDKTPLRTFGWNRLIEQVGKVIVGESVNIIQHPEAQPKKVALRENRVVDILEDFLHYETDTAPGSSGAPVFNDQWELIGLHHSGVPATDEDGNVLTNDGRIWGPQMGEDKIKWLGNEGVRISRIINHAKSQSLTPAQRRLLDEALHASPEERADPSDAVTPQVIPQNDRPEAPVTPSANVVASPNVQVVLDQSGATTLTIPMQISVSITIPGNLTLPGSAVAPDGTLVTPGTLLPEEKLRPEQYRDRAGYDPNFLGVTVPLPRLGSSIASDAAPLIGNPNTNELKYTHFSVVMNRARRMAFFTACNIDGRVARELKRGEDKWVFDPRIKEEYQIGEDAYRSNRLDRGHLVRRLDPVWGDPHVALKADADTFHFTNCSPQHEGFNQKTWLSLETYILSNADDHDLKVTVFTGPVFRNDDKSYRGIRLPQQFWKVVVMKKGNGKLSATGYMLSQKELLNRLEAAFVYGEFKTYQVPIRLIEEMTALDFGTLKSNDPLNARPRRHESMLEADLTEIEMVEIGSAEDLRL